VTKRFREGRTLSLTFDKEKLAAWYITH